MNYENEEWVEVRDYPRYEVSNSGKVRNKETGRILRGRPDREGRLKVGLYSCGVAKNYYVHHLVGEAFHDNYQQGRAVVHLDGDFTNNFSENLRMPIRPDPDRHRSKRELAKGVEIVETGDRFNTVSELATAINGDRTKVYACLRGDRRSHLGFTFAYFEER